MGSNGSYGRLAEVYDILNKDVGYSYFADFYEKCFDRYSQLGKPGIVLDLACGTGIIAQLLSERGYDVIGVDGSAEMLNEASQRRLNAVNPLYLLQDMRSFELYGSVGAVVCSLDSINYLTDGNDVDKCFANVANYLEMGGVFVFDVSSKYRFEHIFADNSYILEDEKENIYCGWQNYYSKESGICDFLISVFIRGKDGRYSRFDESQQERCYSTEYLTQMLEKNKMSVVGLFGDTDFAEVKNNDERIFFVARKNM